MGEPAWDTTARENGLQVEIADLRRGLLPPLLFGLLVLSWLWCVANVLRKGIVTVADLPAVVIVVGGAIAYGLRSRYASLAGWSLCLALIVALTMAAAERTLASLPAYGLLIILIANALLGLRVALAVAALTWLAFSTLTPIAASPWSGGELLLFYGLGWMAIWLVTRPLRTSVDWALSGWTKARRALQEVQERRGELRRTLRALEEATYRLERANNELLVAQREAEAARALKARFVATVSHELRGPLNLVLGFSRLMVLSPERYGEPLPRSYRADIDAIYRNSQHLLALIDDVLDLSQIEAQHLPLVKDRVDLEDDVLTKALDIVAPLAERKGLMLRLEAPRDLPWLLADAVRLRQALLNLLTNAVRFTERGSITVNARRDGEQVLVSVADTGPGIAPDDLPRLFREFSQMHATERREERGSGLGLSISKHLIELHGGTIGVESELGKGTVFTLAVPLPGALAATSSMVRVSTDTRRMPNRPVLLVAHDDPGAIRALARHLEGFQVVGLLDVGDGMAMARQLAPRAIVAHPDKLADLQNRLGEAVDDLLLISCALPRTAEGYSFANVIGYLVKPITPEMLFTALNQLRANGGLRVLVVDDDPDALRLMERLLTAVPHSYDIVKATSGVTALEKMREAPPDVILLDLVMPGMDGRQTLLAMRGDERLARIPVVIVSARDSFDEGMRVRLPLHIHRSQPATIGEIARCVQVVLENLTPRLVSHSESS